MVSSEVERERDAEEIKREKENLRKIEAALFISGRWLTLKELVMLTDLNPLLIRELMEKFVKKYEKRKGAIKIEKRDDMWKMDVLDKYTGIVNKLATGSSEFSEAEQETLAIIAYKQPVKQSVVIKIRGNKAYDHIKKFKDLNLINKKKSGHTYELGLSEEFHDYFHVTGEDKLEKNNNE